MTPRSRRATAFFALFVACVAAGGETALAHAREGAAMDAHGSRPVPSGVQVPTWKQLDPDRQKALAEVADRWDGMSASRRVQLLERYDRWVRLPPDQRERLRVGERNFRHLSPAQRERMRKSFSAMRELPAEEQQRLRATWRAMSPEQRRAWLERGGPGIAPP